MRSITFGLAALGVVTLVNGARKMLANRAEGSTVAPDARVAGEPATVSADILT